MYGGVHMGYIYDVQLKQASKVAKLSLAEYIMFNEKYFACKDVPHIAQTARQRECRNTMKMSLQV